MRLGDKNRYTQNNSRKMNEEVLTLEKKARMSVPISQKVYNIISSKHFFICSCQSKIIVYDALEKHKYRIKVATNDFIVLPFPPFLFVCIIGQFFYFYTEEALSNTNQILKAKISKMNVKAISIHNKGIFLGGYNRSPFPGNNLSNKRTLYYVQKISCEKKNKPLWEIELPKSETPVSFIYDQNPYLVCYIAPSIYVINPVTKNIMLCFQKQIQEFILLEGRYALSCVNFLGISKKTQTLFCADVQREPIYGVQVSEHSEKAYSVCQSKDGQVFFSYMNYIYYYDVFKKVKKQFKVYEKEKIVLQISCTPKNSLIVLVENIGNLDHIKYKDNSLEQTHMLSGPQGNQVTAQFSDEIKISSIKPQSSIPAQSAEQKQVGLQAVQHKVLEFSTTCYIQVFTLE